MPRPPIQVSQTPVLKERDVGPRFSGSPDFGEGKRRRAKVPLGPKGEESPEDEEDDPSVAFLLPGSMASPIDCVFLATSQGGGLAGGRPPPFFCPEFPCTKASSVRRPILGSNPIR